MTAPAPAMPRILLADDHPVVLEGLVATLQPHYEIVAQVQTLETLREAIERTTPDLVLLDLLFDGNSALPLLRELLADPTIRSPFVVLSGAESPVLVGSAKRLGIMAFLPKGVGIEELRRAIDAAVVGRSYVVVAPSSGEAPEDAQTTVWVGGVKLRRRQAEVVWLLLAGLDRRGIATRLDLSKDAVDYHLKNVRRRLGFHSSRQVLAWAAQHRDQFRSAGEGGTHRLP
ncbi:MAG: response regulator transcription factor [Gemmatimonadales bacterium]|nr:response regulator transcription factor [Gemmatimonadales bacterium]MDZ4390119.1 response regulator transcription factor [Gemmatimonadales bacterium]